MLTPEHYRKLLTDFPLLYKNNMYFEVDDGWFELLYRLSQELECQLKFRSDPPKCEDFPHVDQVKTKYGGLRFYTSNIPGYMQDIIDMYETESYTVCEDCGKPGTATGRGWIRTLCPSCADEVKVKT